MERTREKIILKGLKFYGYHGVYPEERLQGQWFEIDAEIWGDFAEAAANDDLKSALDYGQVYMAIKKIVEGKPFNLLEALASRLVREILAFALVEKTRVLVKKPQAPLGGQITYAGVEMTGSKDE